jgi:SAM-dependent methyltransferase
MARTILHRALRSFVTRDLSELRIASHPSPPAPAIHPFDHAHGTDTSGLIHAENLPTRHRNDLWSTAYYGISPALFTHLIDTLAIDHSRFTFLDLGSGKGRALLLASRFPFRRVIGVELSPQLNAIAADNIARFRAPWQQCRTLEAHNTDATTIDYPDGPLVLFLYNPFLPPVLKRCLRNLTRSLTREPREVCLIYVNPPSERTLNRYAPTLRKHWEQTFTLNPEDILSDRATSTQEHAAIYRHQPASPTPRT